MAGGYQEVGRGPAQETSWIIVYIVVRKLAGLRSARARQHSTALSALWVIPVSLSLMRPLAVISWE